MISATLTYAALLAYEPLVAPTVLAKLNVLAEAAEYSLEISETQATGVDRTLRIISTRGCTKPVNIAISYPGFPLGIARISEKYDLISTISGGGTGLILQVYYIRNCNVEKVMDQHIISMPKFDEDQNGNQIVETAEQEDVNARKIVKIWRWDGMKFDLLRK